MSNSQDNWLSEQMRMYVIVAISKTREIKCEECGTYEGLELHHSKYLTDTDGCSINDIEILCAKCHRNDDRKDYSMLRTVFENGRRYCETAKFKFEY